MTLFNLQADTNCVLVMKLRPLNMSLYMQVYVLNIKLFLKLLGPIWEEEERKVRGDMKGVLPHFWLIRRATDVFLGMDLIRMGAFECSPSMDGRRGSPFVPGEEGRGIFQVQEEPYFVSGPSPLPPGWAGPARRLRWKRPPFRHASSSGGASFG